MTRKRVSEKTEEELEIERYLAEVQESGVQECICHEHEADGFKWERGKCPCDRCMYEVFGELPF